MARKLAVEKEVDDMTECPICTELFTDPRILPCIHTFCLKCLENYGKDRPPGSDMSCPLCRKEFTIPDDGLSGIHKNFFMEKLLHARKLLVGEEAHHFQTASGLFDEFTTWSCPLERISYLSFCRIIGFL